MPRWHTVDGGVGHRCQVGRRRIAALNVSLSIGCGVRGPQPVTRNKPTRMPHANGNARPRRSIRPPRAAIKMLPRKEPADPSRLPRRGLNCAVHCRAACAASSLSFSRSTPQSANRVGKPACWATWVRKSANSSAPPPGATRPFPSAAAEINSRYQSPHSRALNRTTWGSIKLIACPWTMSYVAVKGLASAGGAKHRVFDGHAGETGAQLHFAPRGEIFGMIQHAEHFGSRCCQASRLKASDMVLRGLVTVASRAHGPWHRCRSRPLRDAAV